MPSTHSSPNSLFSPHRRRSYSASPATLPAECKVPDDTVRRAVLKRARPQAGSPTPPETMSKWDVELWRRGNTKRARHWEKQAAMRNPEWPSASPAVVASAPFGRATLPSTSAAFQFFPKTRRSERTARRSSLRLSSSSSRTSPEMAYLGTSETPAEIFRLRSDALSDLHRIVAEKGECMVSRMRDLEETRTQSSSGMGHCEEEAEEHTNEEGPWGKSHKKRTFSMNDVDMELANLEPDRSSSFEGSSDLSADCSDVDDDDVEFSLHSSPSASFSSDSIGTPPLSHAFTASTNSSLASLSLSPSVSAPFGASSGSGLGLGAPSYEPFRGATPKPRRPSLSHVSSTSSRSEKALAALTLALANGAGGVNDYDAVLSVDSTADAMMEESHVGAMWD